MKYAVKDAAKVTSAANAIGLGVQEAALQVYIANRPPLPEYEMLSKLQPMQPGDIARIAAETGNHWRKIFNVYAKLVFALKQAQGRDAGVSRWQDYRDQTLLQAQGDESLLFSPPDLTQGSASARLVLAKGYAQALGMNEQLNWLDESFAVHTVSGVIICPYFDYRQLSDIKIQRLVRLLQEG
tara:strand:+ start:101657 stop:102205 length:549 start_codon:yes stop_codon:yes gene_type:complete